ncbi:DNA replication protein DnaC [compost metagenome]
MLDEIGVQYGTDGEQTILFDVLDRRYRDMKPSVFLTNQDKKGFKEFIGERTFDRLTETSRWVPFDWASYRPQARKEAA